MDRYNFRKRKRKLFIPKEKDIPDDYLDESFEDVSHNSDGINSYLSKLIKDQPTKKEKLSKKEKTKLNKLRKKIEQDSPTLSKIISAKIPLSEKITALQLYEALDMMLPKSIEHLETSESIKSIIATDISKDQYHQLERVHKKMKKEKPTVSKILSAYVPMSEKKTMLKLFYIMKNHLPYSKERLECEQNIKKMLTNENYFIGADIDLEEFDRKEKEYEDKMVIGDTELKSRIIYLDAPEQTKMKIYEMYVKMTQFPHNSSERSSLLTKIQWAINLPYGKMKIPENISPKERGQWCQSVLSRINEKIYGLENVKEIIMQYVNNRLCNPKSKTMLALKGQPGLGKTAIAQAIAYGLDLPFERIALGGMIDSSIFKGSNDCWVGSNPSIILQILKRMTYSNGVILFDEIDKLGGLGGLQVQHALLHIADYTQNHEFQDLYLNEFPHDISNVWFMFAMNDQNSIDSTLLDRLKIINVKPYSFQDKIVIIQEYLLPQILKDISLTKECCQITRKACQYLIHLVNSESLRPIAKKLADIIGKINLLNSLNKEIVLSYSLPDFSGFPYIITENTIKKLNKYEAKNTLSYIS